MKQGSGLPKKSHPNLVPNPQCPLYSKILKGSYTYANFQGIHVGRNNTVIYILFLWDWKFTELNLNRSQSPRAPRTAALFLPTTAVDVARALNGQFPASQLPRSRTDHFRRVTPPSLSLQLVVGHHLRVAVFGSGGGHLARPRGE